MKTITLLGSLLLFLCCNKIAYSQHFTIGVKSGINISDIHGQDFGGKWVHKPGPTEGLSIRYSFNRIIGVQTGIEFPSVYYENRTYYSPIYYPYYLNDRMLSAHSSYIIAPPFYYSGSAMNISYLRLPILFSLTIPSDVSFSLRAGIYYSFLQGSSISNYYYSDNIKPKKIDFGYMFSSGLSYPVSEKIKVRMDMNYVTGRKRILEYNDIRNGSTEFMLGFDYDFIRKKEASGTEISKDSTGNKVTITYKTGMNISWNGFSGEGYKFSPVTGPSLGFSVNFPLGHGLSFITGASFERKGYAIKDSSSLFYRYLRSDNQMYFVDTKIQTDYAVIPLLISFPVGRSQKMFFSTGPWLALKLNARNVGTAYNISRSSSNYTRQKTDVYDDMSSIVKDNEMGWLFSYGVSLPLTMKSEISIALQYTTGFRDVYDSSSVSGYYNPYNDSHSIRNRTLSVILGITFPPKGN